MLFIIQKSNSPVYSFNNKQTLEEILAYSILIKRIYYMGINFLKAILKLLHVYQKCVKDLTV